MKALNSDYSLEISVLTSSCRCDLPQILFQKIVSQIVGNPNKRGAQVPKECASGNVLLNRKCRRMSVLPTHDQDFGGILGGSENSDHSWVISQFKRILVFHTASYHGPESLTRIILERIIEKKKKKQTVQLHFRFQFHKAS